MTTEDKADYWDLIIRERSDLFDFRLDQLWRYRDLIVLFVWRDFVSLYKQTILGPLWHIVQPLMTTITYTIIFGNIANLSSDGLPKVLFYMSGSIIWGYFSGCVNSTSNTFIANSGIFSKVYFPRLSVPISILVSKMVGFAIQFSIFVICMIYYRLKGSMIHPNAWMLLTPFLLLLMAGLSFGLGIVVSALTTRYRDLTQLFSFGISLLMYATPVVYPLSSVPEHYRIIIIANPMTAIIETFRYAFLGAGEANLLYLTYSTVVTIVILFVGLLLFTRVERTFMDTI